jgi:hypothetical protein
MEKAARKIIDRTISLAREFLISDIKKRYVQIKAATANVIKM